MSNPVPKEKVAFKQALRDQLAGKPVQQFREREPDPPAPHVGRNDPCPCGSGKKFKRCHLR